MASLGTGILNNHYMGASQNLGYHYGGPNSKDYSILGSLLRSPNFGNYHMTTLNPKPNITWGLESGARSPLHRPSRGSYNGFSLGFRD